MKLAETAPVEAERQVDIFAIVMKKPTLVLTLLCMSGSAVLAQDEVSGVDSSAIGGYAEPDLYEEFEGITEGEEEAGEENTTDWTRADSLQYIPSYALYNDWNTDQIFGNKLDIRQLKDTIKLDLAYAPCDHEIPVCGHVTSPFGPRRGRMHYGVDLKLATGDPVVAAFEGTVRIARYNSSFGNVVVVRHPNGLETLYAHLSKLLVAPGDELNAGQVLGLGGNTGRSSGSHLHFEVRYLGEAIDPQSVFDVTEGELLSNNLHLHAGTFRTTTTYRSAKYHTIRKGETLSGVARRYGTSVSRLCQLNRLSTRSTLRIGQRIRYR